MLANRRQKQQKISNVLSAVEKITTTTTTGPAPVYAHKTRPDVAARATSEERARTRPPGNRLSERL